jgi:hypothetical protein
MRFRVVIVGRSKRWRRPRVLFSRNKNATPALVGADQRPFVDRAVAELQTKMTVLDAVAHISGARWDVDQDAGTITFQHKDGMQVLAPVQIIGTYDTKDGTWLWSWDNPSIEEPLRRASAAVMAYGEEHGISCLTTRKISCEESDCWEFTALAAKLDEAQGAYRGPAGRTYVFMTFGNVEMSKIAP